MLALLVGRSGLSPGWLAAVAIATYEFYLVQAPIGKYTITWMSAQGVYSYLVLATLAASISIAATYAATLGLKAATADRATGNVGERTAEGTDGRLSV